MSAAAQSFGPIPASKPLATMSPGAASAWTSSWTSGKVDKKRAQTGAMTAAPARWGHIKAQVPEGMPLLALEVLQPPKDLLGRRPKPVEQAQARIGERDAPRCAVQQTEPETLLEVPHRVAERRGRDADARRRRPEAEIVGDGNECRQIGKIGAAHC
jgi:hypothetical protein